ncbi:MAG TPA: tetratricopeptide repeat protein [Thermohalobaculum sp.]|nr:tetratricopeptide repeat protein [Thermohalobaculum sp.]
MMQVPWLRYPQRFFPSLSICLFVAACLHAPDSGAVKPSVGPVSELPQSLDRQEAVAHRRLGLGLESAGDIAGAVDEFAAALSLVLWPNQALNGGIDESPQGDLARICELTEPAAQIIRACTLAIGSSRFDRGRLAQMVANRGNAYLRLGEHDRALTDYETSLQIESNEPRGLIGRGRMRARAGDHRAAISDFNRAISAAPKLTEGRLAQARSRIALGEFEAAIVDYDNILADPEMLAAYPDAYRDRAMVHCQNGEADAAAIGWQVWLAATPGGASYVRDMLWARGYLRGAVGTEFDARTLAALRAWTNAGCPGD